LSDGIPRRPGGTRDRRHRAVRLVQDVPKHCPERQPGFAVVEETTRGVNNSLEEFIAAYRHGKVAANGVVVSAPTTAATPDAPAVTVPVRRDHFLSGAVKLAFFVCKAGLKDHHVFAHVQLAALAADSASGRCIGARQRRSGGLQSGNVRCGGHRRDRPRRAHVRRHQSGLPAVARHPLSALSAKALPKPEEIRALLYRM